MCTGKGPQSLGGQDQRLLTARRKACVDREGQHCTDNSCIYYYLLRTFMSTHCLPSPVLSLLHSFSLNSHHYSGVCCYPRVLMRRTSLAGPLHFLVWRSQPAKLGLDPSCLSLCVERTGKASLIILKPLLCWSYCSLLHVEASRFLKINQSSTGCPWDVSSSLPQLRLTRGKESRPTVLFRCRHRQAAALDADGF